MEFDIPIDSSAYRITKRKLNQNEKIGMQMYQSGIACGVPNTALERLLALNERPSIHKLNKLLRRTTELQTQIIDCCRNGCRLFEDATVMVCEVCTLSRYTDSGAPREQFTYLPIVPRILSQLRDRSTATLMEYGFLPGPEAADGEEVYSDIYDGEHYQQLVRSELVERTYGSVPISVGLDGFSFQKKYPDPLFCICD